MTPLLILFAGVQPVVAIGRVPAGALRPGLGCVLLASALALLTKAGADIPAGLIVSVPALAGVAAVALQRSRVNRQIAEASRVPA